VNLKKIIKENLKGNTIEGYLEYFENKYKDSTLIWLDTETTGLNVHDNQLTELSAIVTDSEFNVIDQFSKKIKIDWSNVKDPQRTKDVVLPMTRYGERGVKYHDESETIDEFFDWVDSFDNPVLIAQNASFDIKYLAVRGNRKIDYPVIDTKMVIQLYFIPIIQQLSDENNPEAQEILKQLPPSSRDKGMPSSSMGKIAPILDIDVSGWHSAVEDVKIMIDMFKKIKDYLERHKGLDIRKHQAKRLQSYRESVNIKKIIREELDGWEWAKDSDTPIDWKNIGDEYIPDTHIDVYGNHLKEDDDVQVVDDTSNYYGEILTINKLIPNEEYGYPTTCLGLLDTYEHEGTFFCGAEVKKLGKYLGDNTWDFSTPSTLRESQDDWGWVDDTSTFHGIIIDTLRSKTPKQDILEMLDGEGFTWSSGNNIFHFNTERYIFVGPMNIHIGSITGRARIMELKEKRIMHDSKLEPYPKINGEETEKFIVTL
jgi:DNA polymerase III epsilon subunit-like protein